MAFFPGLQLAGQTKPLFSFTKIIAWSFLKISEIFLPTSLWFISKAFIFPSNEDFGIVPVEALASGRPVIAFKAGGALETINDRVTGIFFEEQTPESLVKAVGKFESMHFEPKKLRQAAEVFDETVFRKKFKETVEAMVADYRKNGPPLC